MFVDRRRRRDRHLVWKVRIFSLAAGIALVGIYLDERWMTGVALVLLGFGVALRFLPGGGEASAEEYEPAEPADSGEPPAP